jgi:hypothetical protein
METIKLVKAYKPLITKFLKVDNYDKMKAILDIGFSGIDVIDKYYKNTNSSLVLSDEMVILKKQLEELERINIEVKKEKNLLEEEKHNEIMNIRKGLDEKYGERIDDLNNKVIETKNTYMDKLFETNEKLQEKFFKELNDMKEEKNKEIDYFKKIVEENQKRSDEILERELIKIKREKDKLIEELEKENMHFKNKYEKLELKSVKKGKPYEDAIEDELREYFVKHDKTYCLERCSNMKGKGDFVVTNNYSGLRIMLEAKNMPKVSSSVKDQLPKFYDNVNDKINAYDGGIVIAIENIETKKNYDIEILPNNKVVSFIENYTLNTPERIYAMIEMVHKKIKEVQSGKTLSRTQVLNEKVEDYKNVRDSYNKMKIAYEQQTTLIGKMRENILNLFGIDVDEYILNMNNTEKSTKENVSDKLGDFIKNKLIENPKMKDVELKNYINVEFKEYIDLYEKGNDKVNGISKRKITTIIKAIRTGNGEKNKKIETPILTIET